MKLLIDNVYTQIQYEEGKEFEKYFDDVLHSNIDPLDPNRYMKSAYRKHYWDGRITVYNVQNKVFPTGLVGDVIELIKQTQKSYPLVRMDIQDVRGLPIGAKNIPDTITLKDTPKGDLILDPNDPVRGYQYDAVKFCIDEQRGYVGAATGSGKTLIAEALIQIDRENLSNNDKILFIVHNKIIAYQTKKRFEESLHIPIGFWGDGQKDIQQVTVCLVGTIASGLKKPEDSVKLTSNKDKVLKAIVTKYIPKLESYPNIKVVVKNFIKNNQPQYAYEEPVWEAFSDMVQPSMKDKDILKIFDSYKKQYDKLLKKKASKVYDKYHSTKDILDSVRVVIVDESHHISSNQYQTVMNSLPNARQRIGLSGSISQSDDVKWTALKSVISDKIFKISNKQMIDSGVSAKPYIQFIPIDEPKNLDEQVKDSLPANLDENNQALLVYQEAYRQGIIENDYRNMIIVQLLKKLYETDKTALVVVSSIEHGETLQSMLKTMRIPSAFLRGDVPMSDRQDIIDNIKAGKSKIVFGTSVVNEGMDIPSLKYLVYASAGKASTPVLQRVGRVLRKSSDKDTALIFDFSDNMSKVLYKQSMERKMIYTKEGFQLIDK